jgi:hypothetical protein
MSACTCQSRKSEPAKLSPCKFALFVRAEAAPACRPGLHHPSPNAAFDVIWTMTRKTFTNMVAFGTFVFALLLVQPSASQSTPERIIKGPLGTPTALKDEDGNWAMPLLVYSDPDIDIFIPDVTDRGWLAWHVEQYRQTGRYVTVFLEHYKTDRLCRENFLSPASRNNPSAISACKEVAYGSRMMRVNTRDKSVTVDRLLLMNEDGIANPSNEIGKPQILSFSAVGPRTQSALARASELVATASSRFTGLTIEEAVRQDAAVQLKTACLAFANCKENDTNAPPAHSQGESPPQSKGRILSGRYEGQVRNLTHQLLANVEVILSESEGASSIAGCMAIHRPLYGSGKLRGELKSTSVTFTVSGLAGPIKFEGQRSGEDISGTYSILQGRRDEGGVFELHRKTTTIPTDFDPQKCADDSVIQ